VGAVWDKVHVRGHAAEVLAAARALNSLTDEAGESDPGQAPASGA
jgi:hypothetical protein